MINSVRQNGIDEINYVKEIEFIKNGITYYGKLEWIKDEGFTFYPDTDSQDPDLTYEEMLLIDEQTNEQE